MPTSEALYKIVTDNLDVERDVPPRQVYSASCGEWDTHDALVLVGRSAAPARADYVYVGVEVRAKGAARGRPLAEWWFLVEALTADGLTDAATAVNRATVDPEAATSEYAK